VAEGDAPRDGEAEATPREFGRRARGEEAAAHLIGQAAAGVLHREAHGIVAVGTLLALDVIEPIAPAPSSSPEVR
jgi:hypothetical protein